MKCLWLMALAFTYVTAKVDYMIQQNEAVKVDRNDEGEAINCAKDQVPDFSLTWSPKVLQLGGSVTVSFHMTTVEALDGGSLNATVWLPGTPEPFFSQELKFTCDDIHKVVPFFCPFKKGEKITFPPTKLALLPTLPIPEGTFIIKGQAYNEDMKLFACLKATLIVKA